jgi:hypothetical protein
VIAWQYPIAFASAPCAPIGSVLDTDLATSAEQVLGAAISETVDASSPVNVSATAREGNPAQILLGAATGAELLVGSRGPPWALAADVPRRRREEDSSAGIRTFGPTAAHRPRARW